MNCFNNFCFLLVLLPPGKNLSQHSTSSLHIFIALQKYTYIQMLLNATGKLATKVFVWRRVWELILQEGFPWKIKEVNGSQNIRRTRKTWKEHVLFDKWFLIFIPSTSHDFLLHGLLCCTCYYSEGGTTTLDFILTFLLVCFLSSFWAIPSGWWRATTVIAGSGAVLSFIVGVTVAISCCISDVLNSSSARFAGSLQLFSGLLLK